MTTRLSSTGAGPVEETQKWIAEAKTKEAAVREAQAEVERAKLRYQSQIDGVNTTVAATQSELDQAQYFLDNTTLVAPDDGMIVNLQVRVGMVAGDYRFGAIATLVCDGDRYMLATFNQEVLKFVAIGQPSEVALELYPGQIFQGTVLGIWPSGEGQLLPSGTLPKFEAPPPKAPQGRFAVAFRFTDDDQSLFPIGAQGAVAIYTGNRAWAALRRIGIRAHSWLNWLYPMPF
jgi:multidrug resistance efflux pump